MIAHRIAFVPLLFIAVAGAHGPKTLDQLRVSAAKAKGGTQAKLYAELSERLVDVADGEFNGGESVKGQATVQEALQDATKAHDGALAARNHRKEVEIHLRKTERRLEDVKQSLAAVDRPPLDQAESKIAQFRQELLDSMFAPHHKKKEAK